MRVPNPVPRLRCVPVHPPPSVPRSAIRNRVDPWSSPSHVSTNTFRVLSLDGGGVRGVLTAVILARIEREYPSFLDQHVDLVAGSSTGGLIGLLLAAGYTASECLEIYKVCAAERSPSQRPLHVSLLPQAWIPRIFSQSRYLPIEYAKYCSKAK